MVKIYFQLICLWLRLLGQLCIIILLVLILLDTYGCLPKYFYHKGNLTYKPLGNGTIKPLVNGTIPYSRMFINYTGIMEDYTMYTLVDENNNPIPAPQGIPLRFYNVNCQMQTYQTDCPDFHVFQDVDSLSIYWAENMTYYRVSLRGAVVGTFKPNISKLNGTGIVTWVRS